MKPTGIHLTWETVITAAVSGAKLLIASCWIDTTLVNVEVEIYAG